MKVMRKMFKSNVSNCALCLVSAGLVTAVLFLFEGMKILILGTLNEYDRTKSSIGIAVQSYIYVLLFIGVILILYTVSCYNRVRIRDYAMFMVLGAEKKNIIGLILKEYGMIYGVSYVAGCAAGTLLLLFVQYIFREQEIAVGLKALSFLGTAGMVFLYMLFIFAVSALVNCINLHNHSLSSLLAFQKKKSRTPSAKHSIAGVAAGFLCLAAAVRLFTWTPADYRRIQSGFLLFLCSMYLFFTYLGFLVLMLFKRREKWYNKYLLKVKNLYFRFSENKNLMLLIFIINFFVLVVVNMNVVEYGNVSSKYLWKYPYDYVWMADQENARRIGEAVQASEHETNIYPYVTLSSNDGGAYVGISEYSYRRLTGNEESLNPGELISLIQKSESDTDVVFQDDTICLWEGEEIKDFRLRQERNEILFIAQQAELIGVVVMNDEDFASMDSHQEKKTAIITQNVAGDTLAQGERLGEIAGQCHAVLYSKMSLMRQDRQQDVTALIFYIALGMFLILCGMTVLAVKMWSEIPFLGDKYGFLKKIGMDEREIISSMKGELSICLKIPFWLSVATGIGVIVYMARGRQATLILEIGAVFAALVIVQELYIAGIRSYGSRLAGRRISEGK